MLNNAINSKLGERKLRVNRVIRFFVKARQSLNVVTDDDDNFVPFESSSFKLITISLINIIR